MPNSKENASDEETTIQWRIFVDRTVWPVASIVVEGAEIDFNQEEATLTISDEKSVTIAQFSAVTGFAEERVLVTEEGGV